MTDDIQCAKYFPNGEHYAVALIDCTIKVYFSDSNKSQNSQYIEKI